MKSKNIFLFGYLCLSTVYASLIINVKQRLHFDGAAPEGYEEESTNPTETTTTTVGLPTTTSTTTPAPTTATTVGSTTTTPVVTTTTTSCTALRAYCPNCGEAPINVTNFRISGGAAASVNEYPYQVVIKILFGAVELCSGAIIKENWIITSASCFYNANGVQLMFSTLVQIAMGGNDRSALTFIGITSFKVHDSYTPGSPDNNIALINLATAITFSDSVKPICIGEESDIGSKAVVTGWGKTTSSGSLVNDLQEAAVDIVDTSTCSSSGITLQSSTAEALCTSSATTGACTGDLGSPLVGQLCNDKWVLIGIKIAGDTCTSSGSPNLYTRVPAFRSWIDSQTGSSTSC